MGTNALEEPAAFIFREEDSSTLKMEEVGFSETLIHYLPYNMVSHPRRQYSSSYSK
jgi:hypothetical protein